MLTNISIFTYDYLPSPFGSESEEFVFFILILFAIFYVLFLVYRKIWLLPFAVLFLVFPFELIHLNFKYEEIHPTDGNYFVFLENEKVGIANCNYEEVIPAIFDGFTTCTKLPNDDHSEKASNRDFQVYSILCKNGKYFAFTSNKQIIPIVRIIKKKEAYAINDSEVDVFGYLMSVNSHDVTYFHFISPDGLYIGHGRFYIIGETGDSDKAVAFSDDKETWDVYTMQLPDIIHYVSTDEELCKKVTMDFDDLGTIESYGGIINGAIYLSNRAVPDDDEYVFEK